MPSASVTSASTASVRQDALMRKALGSDIQKLKFLSESGSGDCITAASCAAWRSRIPELEVAAHAEQHHVAHEAGGGAQLGRDQDARRRVDVDVHRVAEEDALPSARIHRQGGDPIAELLPRRTRKDQQRAFGVLRHGELVHAHRRQQLAMARRHRNAALAVQRQCRRALKHDVRHKTPRKCTSCHCNGRPREGQFIAEIKINGINNLLATAVDR